MRERILYKKKPMLLMIIIPLMLLLLVEAAVIIGGFYGQGISQRLRDNAKEIINGRTMTRRGGLESVISGQWMNIEHTIRRVNDITDELIASGDISLSSIDRSSEDAGPLLSRATEELIALMRSNRVNGAFIVLNRSDLSVDMERGRYRNKPGLYLRDLDPISRAANKNEDILLERSPARIVSENRLSTDKSWDVSFAFENLSKPYYDFLYYPMQAALKSSEKDWKELGYWSRPYQLEGEGRTVISYSVPLILSSGEVYGVLGIDVIIEQLGTLLPYGELDSKGRGAYFLAYQPDSGQEDMGVSIVSDNKGCRLVEDWDNSFLEKRDYIYKEPIRMNNSSEIYGEGRFWFGAALDYEFIEEYSSNLMYSTWISLGIALLIGVFGSILVGFWLQRPVQYIVKSIRSQSVDEAIQLEKTGVIELDEMIDALDILSRRLLKERENIRFERDHDFLTGLYNRRAFDREMQKLLDEKTVEGGIGAYMMMDLDNLKLVNDSYGHEYGDKYISAAARAIKEAIGDEGLYSRVSGDEFNVFLYRADGNRKKLESLIARMSNALYSAYVDLPGGERQFVRISGGISWYPEEGVQTDELAKKADLAMYVVKKATKEQIRRQRRKS